MVIALGDVVMIRGELPHEGFLLVGSVIYGPPSILECFQGWHLVL